MEVKIADEFFYRIKENCEEINKIFNTSQENTTRNNKDLNLYCGEWVKIKVNDYILHCVKPMQTLDCVSQIHNVSVDKLKRDNNLKDNKLFIGQMLKIYNEKTTIN